MNNLVPKNKKEAAEKLDKDLNKEAKLHNFNESLIEREISQNSEITLRKKTVEESEINSRKDSQHSNSKGKRIDGEKNRSNIKEDLDSQSMNRKENNKRYLGEKSSLRIEESRRESYQSKEREEKLSTLDILEIADKKGERDKNNRLNLPEIQGTQDDELESGVKNYADKDFNSGLKLPALKHQSVCKRKISIYQEKFMSEELASLEEFKNQIDLVFTENFEHDSFVKKGNFHQKLVDSLIAKIDSKIRDNESTILQKQRQLLFLRKENSYILEKISSLKTNVNFYL